jgi:hypothetical protein
MSRQVCALLLVSVTVKPQSWTDRVAAELIRRLGSHANLEVNSHGSGIGVLRTSESPREASEFDRLVTQALDGIEQELSEERLRAGLPRLQIDMH